MTLAAYGLYAGVTLALSTVFAMGGAGSAVALVPVFHLMGLPLDLARANGLFVNSALTVTASVMNARRGMLYLSSAQLKHLISALLLILAAKMIFDLLAG